MIFMRRIIMDKSCVVIRSYNEREIIHDVIKEWYPAIERRG